VVCFHRADRRGDQLLPFAGHQVSFRRWRGRRFSERIGCCGSMVSIGPPRHNVWCRAHGEPNRWGRCAIAGSTDPDSVRMAGVVFRPGATGHSFPWRTAFRSESALALVATAFCYVYVYNFFQTWFHTFLVKGRGFHETGLWLSALPYIVGVLGNLAGGAVSDSLVRKLGRKRGRRTTGAAALTVAGLFTVAAMVTRQQFLTVAFLAVVYGAIAFQQSAVFGVCLDIGKKHAGAMVGLMNTAAQLGGLVGAVAYGYLVEHFGNYNAPFVPMAAVLFLGATLWLRIDASQELHSDPHISPERLNA
jgi:MFS family permease